MTEMFNSFMTEAVIIQKPWFLYDNGLRHERVKSKNELAPPIMDSMFEKRNEPYNLRNFQEFSTERKRTVYYGLETLS